MVKNEKLKVLKEHIEFKKTSVTSEQKLKEIERYLNRFLKSSNKTLGKFTESDLTNFINSLTQEFGIRSINSIKVYLKVFIKWYFEDYSSRFRNLDRLCKSQEPPQAYEPEQMLEEKDIKKLIEGENDLMWKVFWLVFFYGGMRGVENRSLAWEQVFFEKKGVIIKIYSKKNKKKFYKALPKEVEHYLKEWKKFNQSQWVFPSPIKEGEHIARKTIYHRLVKLSKKVLGKSVSPSILRSSFATLKYNNDNLKDDDVANQMGHSKSMKKTYVILDDEKLKARARLMWVKPKELSPEEENELKKEVKELRETQEALLNEHKLLIDIYNEGRKISGIQKKQMEKAKPIIMKKGFSAPLKLD